MASFNKVILMGNLTRDPEVKHISSGTAVAQLGLAVKQYKIAKQHNWEAVSTHEKRRQLAQEVSLILQRSEQDRTPEEKAKVKLLEDADYWENQRFYDYQDDWDEM